MTILSISTHSFSILFSVLFSLSLFYLIVFTVYLVDSGIVGSLAEYAVVCDRNYGSDSDERGAHDETNGNH